MALKRVVVDTDVAVGIPERDVDDALAIIMAANSASIELCGITLTYGNDSLKNVERSMTELGSVAGLAKVKIAAGARSCEDLGKDTAATALLAEIAQGGRMTVLCLGPATNLASFVEADKDLASQIDEVVLVAGRRRGQRFRTGNYARSHPDLNFENDPEAVRRLLNCRLKLVFAPFEVSSKVWITDHILDLIECNGTETARYLVDKCSPWLAFWRQTFSTQLRLIDGFNPFDCLAVAWLTDQDLLFWEEVEMLIDEDNYDAGEMMVQGTSGSKKYLHAQQMCSRVVGAGKTDGGIALPGQVKQHVYIYDVEREVFLERLITRLR
ncbi:MAG: nucleoside hydrolase [Candidatus Melainabacteria bacterium]|nr:nucleoside hydrolase [Candidatus Melainabacteria bacterium]